MRRTSRRLPPRIGRRVLAVMVVLGLVVVAATFVLWGSPQPELRLVALGPDGAFQDTVAIPADWGDTATVTTDAVARFRLVLGIRNVGFRTAQPGRLVLSVPARYRLTGARGEALAAASDPASPLVRYLIEPRLEPVEPGLPVVSLPGHETLWLEAVIPRIYCVELADSIPDFVPAPPPPLQAMSEVRLLYSFEGGELDRRHTGIVTLHLDTTLMAVTVPQQPPTFPMVVDPVLARPPLGPLQYAGSRQVRCGEPEAPMEFLSTVWETETGARLITVDYGGVVRKHLFDLNGDGIIDRESWDPDGTGRITATRRAALPTPAFLLPVVSVSAFYDMAAFQGLAPDSLARLDPFRGAMAGPGPMPRPGDPFDGPLVAPPAPTRPALPGRPVTEEPAPPPTPSPTTPGRQPVGRPLGRPIDR